MDHQMVRLFAMFSAWGVQLKNEKFYIKGTSKIADGEFKHYFLKEYILTMEPYSLKEMRFRNSNSIPLRGYCFKVNSSSLRKDGLEILNSISGNRV